jgi:hypothetical protein
MNNNKQYFIHLASANLAHFFLGGIITPTKYIENRASDIQNSLEGCLLFSNKKWSENHDCSVEIILTEGEASLLQQIDSHYYFASIALPTSRIKAVFFTNQQQADTTIWNINAGAGFVPKRLVKAETKKQDEVAQTLTATAKATEASNLDKNLAIYNRLLGGFAFMRLGTNDPNDHQINYSENYISTLAYFNKLIEQRYLTQGFQLHKDYYPLFNNHNQENKVEKYRHFLGKDLTEESIKNIATREQISLDSKFGIINLDKIPKNSLVYGLSVLANYGASKRKSIEDLVADMTSGKIHQDKIEGIALIFGLHVGYKKLRNLYKVRDLKKVTKFKLETVLDYYTIESLYQYAFHNQQITERFEYLKEALPIDTIETNELPDYTYYQILGAQIVTKQKDYSEQVIDKLIDSVLQEISNWFPKNLFSLNTRQMLLKLRPRVKPIIDSLLPKKPIGYEEKLQKANETIHNLQTKIKELEVQKEVSNYPSIPHVKTKNIAQENQVKYSSGESNKNNKYKLNRLKSLKKQDLQNQAKNLGIPFKNKDTKELLIKKITEHKISNNPSLFKN